MNTAKKLRKDKYTYTDYLTFPDEDRCEIINGEVVKMSPAPVRKHQTISMELSRQISNFLVGKDCRIYSAPFDVRFQNENNEIENVLQPDISIVCDKNKLDDKGCIGAPDWIIEILSPSTSQMDLQDKFKIYEKFGVKEYWIVEPIDNFIMVFRLDESGKYQNIERYTASDKAKTIFDDLEIDLNLVFEDIG